MSHGSATTYWNYAFLCAWFVQHLYGCISWSELFLRSLWSAQWGFPSFSVLPVAIAMVGEYGLVLVTKVNYQRATGKRVCSACKSFRYLWDLFPPSNFITAFISGLYQLVTMVDDNDIISKIKGMCFHPKGSKCALPEYGAVTLTPWL